jgi:hypothetical protein
MFGNLGGLISTWTYLPRDGPNYHNGNSLNLGTSSAWVVTAACLLLWMRLQNKKKAAQPVTTPDAEQKSGRAQ